MLCWKKPGEHQLLETLGGDFFFPSGFSTWCNLPLEAQNLPLEFQDWETSGR